MKKTRKIHIWCYSLLSAALIIAVVWGWNKSTNAKSMQTEINNNYTRAFSELADYIDNIEVQLAKSRLVSTPSQMASVANDIFSEAAQAKSCLGQLPTSQIQLENTSKFLSQVGDYTYVLSQKMINDESISDEEYETLASLNEYASSLRDSLRGLQDKIYSGEMQFYTIEAKNVFNTVNADEENIIESMENVEKAFDEYPSLIYDGPFSEHIENMTPKMISDKEQITRDEALRKAKDFIGERGNELEFSSESENTAMPSYTFATSTPDEQISVSVTKQGGYVLYFLDNTIIHNQNLSVSDAKERALKFLESNGFHNMTNSYYEKDGNIATLNFAYEQNGIVCYSDLIKVSVALDDGEIVGFEAKGFLMNHFEREISEPLISTDEAKDRVSHSLDVTSTNLAVIPKDSLKEILCYEFKGTFNDKNFIVYINALNGREEKILLLIESEDGILTI